MKKLPVYILLMTGFLSLKLRLEENAFRLQAKKDVIAETNRQHEKMISLYLFFPEGSMDSFFINCRNWGINSIWTGVTKWENENFIQKAAIHNLEVNLLFPVFFNKEYLELHPQEYCLSSKGDKAINDWLHFACPSSEPYRAFQKKLLKEQLAVMKPRKVVFDFIRFYVYWERVAANATITGIEDGCYCERCITRFETFSGLSVKGKTAGWIKQNVLPQWMAWKCAVIENTVKEFTAIVKAYDPSVEVGIKTVPWTQNQYNGGIKSIAGQNVARLKNEVDFFLPMTYAHLLNQNPLWINSILREIKTITGKKVYATVQAEKVFPEQNAVSDNEFKNMLQNGLTPPSGGMVLFHYSYLLANSKRAAAMKNYF